MSNFPVSIGGSILVDVLFTLNDQPMDVTLYTIECGIKPASFTAGQNSVDFLNGASHVPLVVTNPSPVATNGVQIFLTAATTALWASTDGHDEVLWPRIDFKFTEIADPSNIFFIPVGGDAVEILSTYAVP